MTNMRPKTYFLRPDVATPLGFALLREIWNQKVGGWVAGRLGSTQLASGEHSYPRQLGRLAWGACACVLITALAAAAVVAPLVRPFLPVSLSVRQP